MRDVRLFVFPTARLQAAHAGLTTIHRHDAKCAPSRDEMRMMLVWLAMSHYWALTTVLAIGIMQWKPIIYIHVRLKSNMMYRSLNIYAVNLMFFQIFFYFQFFILHLVFLALWSLYVCMYL